MYPENKQNYNPPANWNNEKKFGPDSQLQPQQSQAKKAAVLQVGRTEKSMVVKWAENCGLRKLERVVTDHGDAILCIYFVDSRYIATGSKDKTINIYTFDGKKVRTLKGHDASICSLSSVQNRNYQTFLASGSDHGCCCLILWNTKTW